MSSTSTSSTGTGDATQRSCRSVSHSSPRRSAGWVASSQPSSNPANAVARGTQPRPGISPLDGQRARVGIGIRLRAAARYSASTSSSAGSSSHQSWRGTSNCCTLPQGPT